VKLWSWGQGQMLELDPLKIAIIFFGFAIVQLVSGDNWWNLVIGCALLVYALWQFSGSLTRWWTNKSTEGRS
jgi:hypothetical protein